MNDVGKQEHKEKKAAVILAAGSGRRMNTPVAKQFLDLMGIPVFLHSVRLFDKIADKIVLVTSPDAVEYCQNLLEKEELCAEVIVIAGKSERFLSSMEGVRAASDCDLIMIHDAARACVDMEVIERYIHNKFIEWGVRFVSIVDNADTDVAGNKKSRQIIRQAKSHNENSIVVATGCYAEVSKAELEKVEELDIIVRKCR